MIRTKYIPAVFLGMLPAIILAAFCIEPAFATVSSPEKGESITLVIGDNESPYFKLDVDSSTYLDVTGPGNLKLLIRFTMPPKSASTVHWGIRIFEGAALATTLDTVTSASEATWKHSPLQPGEACRFSMDVPDGAHRYRLSLTSPVKSFAGVRYLYTIGTAHQDKSAVYPIDMLGPTSVQFKEKVLDFFLADSTKPVKVRVIGPTRLRIVTRLAYSGVMKGPQKYSAEIEIDSKQVSRAALETSKSPATYFTNHKEWSVGESRTTYIDIPAGKHEVNVRLGSSQAPALAMRFTIPSEDIGK